MEVLRVVVLTLCCATVFGWRGRSRADELLRRLFLRSSGSPTCNTPSRTGSDDADEFVKAHNKFRAQVGASDMIKLKWDNDLAKVTQELVDKCVWKHDLLQNCGGDRTGQNLYVSYTSGPNIKLNPTKAVTSWFNEVSDYNYDTGKCRKGKVCGHYTQVVWSSSYLVGCAAQICDSVEGLSWGSGKYVLVACNYSPPGNWRGSKPFKKGGACSDCPSKFPSCEQGLCK